MNSFTDASVPVGAISLHYYVEAIADAPCLSTRANHNQSRSNKTAPIGGPIETSIEENALEAEFLIYPNPSNGKINVRASNINYNYSISIFNMDGKLIFKEEFNSGSNAIIDLQNKSKGLYTIKLECLRKVSVKKLVVN